ncbi:hypothetical protein B0H14DRAFT_2569664 [Mycena olivaceomarginata]|nr:hypothetical protein B0H14DRAFT_2569664 [Mycena olivaceomarginata]
MPYLILPLASCMTDVERCLAGENIVDVNFNPVAIVSLTAYLVNHLLIKFLPSGEPLLREVHSPRLFERDSAVCCGVLAICWYWDDDLLGEYLMFKTHSGSYFYPARVAGITSTGHVQMEWYQDNIYERNEKPVESEFLCSKQECANAAAGDPDELFDKDNVGAIRWPPRLLEDASQYFAYEISEISATLLAARPAAIAIIMGTKSHPITSDYDEWMADAPELREAKHAERFAEKFQRAGILLGDVSLAEVHTAHVFEVVTASHRESTDDFPESLRLRANFLAAVLFHLVILRIYLCRSALDDLQIYFLARHFTSEELSSVATDDPVAVAKMGQVPEPFFGTQTTPRKWYKIKTIIRKAGAARIPASFLLAGAHDLQGNDYEWEANKPEGQKPTESTCSSPLSEAPHSDPMDVDSAQETNVVGPPTIVAVIEPKGLKRKRVDDSKEEENGEEDRLAPGFHFRVGMRRSARTRIARNGG